jgi:dCTP deaminase
MTNGVLPSQALRGLIAQGAIAADPAVLEDQLQPASLDLRLGAVAYRVRASFLAGKGRKVQDRLEELRLSDPLGRTP